jgi:hypothetical protein
LNHDYYSKCSASNAEAFLSVLLEPEQQTAYNCLELLAAGFDECDSCKSETPIPVRVYHGPLDAAHRLPGSLLRQTNAIALT